MLIPLFFNIILKNIIKGVVVECAPVFLEQEFERAQFVKSTKFNLSTPKFEKISKGAPEDLEPAPPSTPEK